MPYVAVGFSNSDYIASPTSANVEITAALAASDTVLIKNGTYNFADTLTLASNKTLIGESRDGVILKMNAGVNKTVITNANASSGGMTTGVTIKNLTIDQQGAAQTAGGGIVVTGIQNWTMVDVLFKKSYRFNFLCLHQSTGISNQTGTITVTQASATATGSGTSFLTNLAVGSIIKTAGNAFGRVQSIETNTSLTLTLPWASATESGVTHKLIQPNSGCRFTRIQYQGTVNDADASGYGFFDNGIVEDSVAFGANTGGCGFVPDHARSMQLNNCISYNNDNSGISLETCEDCIINSPRVFNNVNGNGLQFISGTSRCQVNYGMAYGHTNNGYVVSYNNVNAGVPRGNVFTNCFGYLNGGYGFRNDGGVTTEYNLCRGYNNDTGGVIINTSNASVPNLVNVHDSLFFDDRTVKSQDRGIYVVAATTTTVANNTALNALHTVAGIVDTATGTILTGNTT